MNEIFVANNIDEILDCIKKINLDTDIIFSLQEGSKKYINFGFSGGVNFKFGEPVNLSNLKPKYGQNSPIRTWKTKLDLKFCCPKGIHPLIIKPDNYKSIIGITSSYTDYLNVKIDNFSNLKNIKSSESVIYQDIEIEITFNKDTLLEELPMLILPNDTTLFSILPTRTFFSNQVGIGNIFIFKNDEFYYKFKESV